MKTPPDKRIAFTFRSHPTKDESLRWRATIVFPPGAVDITIVDDEGNRIKSAVFVFAGKELSVVDGSASMTFAEFVAGKHSVPIWLHRKGLRPVPGVPTFE